MAKVPPEIIAQVLRLERTLFCHQVQPIPPYAPNNTLAALYYQLSVAECEQLVEQHSRNAVDQIGSYLEQKTTGWLRWPAEHQRICFAIEKAANSILLARVYRIRALVLMGSEDEAIDEDAMPFSHWDLPLGLAEVEELAP